MTNEKREAALLPCEVVRDLLPLHADGLVSEKTAKAVDMHLEDCADCRKEYGMIKIELSPESEKPSTGERFAMMMKKLRLRRIFAIVITAMLTCAVLAGGFYGLTQIPVRRLDPGNISVEKAFVYEEDGETRLYLLYLLPVWNSPTFHNIAIAETSEPGVWALECEYKVAAISGRFDEPDEWESMWDLKIDADIKDVKAVTFNGENIWESKNAKPVPDYVRAYRDYTGYMDKFNGMTVDVEKNLIGFDNAQERYYIYWDLDGNLLYEGDGKDADKVIDFDVPDNPPVIDE